MPFEDVKKYSHLPEFISPDGEIMMYYDDGLFRRFEFNSASEVPLAITLPEVDTEQPYLYPRYFTWFMRGEWAYIMWKDNLSYRISRDGKTVEPLESAQTRASPDGNWNWFQEDKQYFITNLGDSMQYSFPRPNAPHSFAWTPDNALIVRYTVRSDAVTIMKFQDGAWTTLAESIQAFEGTFGQYSPMSPDKTHYLYFDSEWHLYIMDLFNGQAAYVDEAIQGHVWNETGEWFVHFKSEAPNQVAVSVYDVTNGTDSNLFSFTLVSYYYSFDTIDGTNFFLLDWADHAGPDDVLIDVKTGQTLELDPDIDVISKWNLPDGPPPRYSLHALIALLLIGVPVGTKVARRKLSA